MLDNSSQSKAHICTALGFVLTMTILMAGEAQSSEMSEEYVTAGKVLEELQPNEFVWYVGGIVEGLAYARFRKDTVAAGEKVVAGSDCIRNWFFETQGRTLTIRSTFEQYGDYTPWVVIAAMVKQECGE